MVIELIAAVIAILIGIGLTFMGYYLFRLLLPIWGFFLGVWLGLAGVEALFGSGLISTGTGLIIGLVLGLVLGLLSYFFYALGIFMLGMSVGYGLFVYLMSLLGFNSNLARVPVGIIGACLGGGLALKFNLRKYLAIVLTAAVGAALIVLGFLLVSGQATVDDISTGLALKVIYNASLLWFLVWLGVAGVGIAAQTGAVRRFGPNRSLGRPQTQPH